MSTENNTGVQTRAMAQRVDNEANPEQLQRAMDPAMNPTVELHRTKEDAIEPSTKRILQNIKLRVKPQDRRSVHIPRPPRGHRY